MSLIVWFILQIIELVKEEERQFWKDEGFSLVPIFKKKGKWYFWDEIWADFYGPFDTKREVIKALKDYCFILDMDIRKSIEANKGTVWAEIQKGIACSFKGEHYL